MKVAHFDLISGISGDMTLGALVDAGAPIAGIRKILAAVPIKPWTLVARRLEKSGVFATAIDVRFDPRRRWSTRDILSAVRKARIPAGIRAAAQALFERVHEAGIASHDADTMVDFVGSAAGFHLLGIERASASPVPVSTRTLPAALRLLSGFRIRPLDSEHELVTATGAAILSRLADSAANVGDLRLEIVGVGAGKATLDHPNVLRLLVGSAPATEESDLVWEIDTNLDNASGELVGYLFETLFEAGAVDVFTTPVQMKKSRPAVKLSVIVPPSRRETVESILLRETPTFGVRRVLMERSKLARREITVTTRFGPIRCKIGSLQGEQLKASPEFEDVRSAARAHHVPLSKVIEEVRRHL